MPDTGTTPTPFDEREDVGSEAYWHAMTDRYETELASLRTRLAEAESLSRICGPCEQGTHLFCNRLTNCLCNHPDHAGYPAAEFRSLRTRLAEAEAAAKTKGKMMVALAAETDRLTARAERAEAEAKALDKDNAEAHDVMVAAIARAERAEAALREIDRLAGDYPNDRVAVLRQHLSEIALVVRHALKEGES